MSHKQQSDDEQIIQLCKKYNYICTYDEDNSWEKQQNLKSAIKSVLNSRQKESIWMGGVVEQTKNVMDYLQKLFQNTDFLLKNPKDDVYGTLKDIDEKLKEELKKLKDNYDVLSDAKKMMELKNIRVPVVGVINSGKSSFLRSALGSENKEIAKNLFPSGDAGKSCTGTRTTLVYDDNDSSTKQLTVIVHYKSKSAFIDSCQKIIEGTKKILTSNNKLYASLNNLEKELKNNNVDIFKVLLEYAKSNEFLEICNRRYNEKHIETVNSFCSMIHFVKKEDFTEKCKHKGNPNNLTDIKSLKQCWANNKPFFITIENKNNYENFKQYVCKYDPNNIETRFSTYFGVEKIEIRGQLCEQITGLELEDCIGGDDPAIENSKIIKRLIKNSDAMILLERPTSLVQSEWQTYAYVREIKTEKFAPGIYLIYNNDGKNTSYIKYKLIDSPQYDYLDDCKEIYVTNLKKPIEVQSRMLVCMLENLVDNFNGIHKKRLIRAREANNEINRSIKNIRRLTNKLLNICNVKNDSTTKEQYINQVIIDVQQAIQCLYKDIKIKPNDLLKNQIGEITNKIIEKNEEHGNDLLIVPNYFQVTASCIMSKNRYTKFLCLYSKMLENIRKQFYTLQDDINSYVEEKRREMINIFLKQGRFKNIMNLTANADINEIVNWLVDHQQLQLANLLQENLQKGLSIRAEELIQCSIDKGIQQFYPANLTIDKLFGKDLSNPDLEMNSDELNTVIKEQLMNLAEELKCNLLECINPNNPNLYDLDNQLRVEKICGVLTKLLDLIAGAGSAHTPMYDLLHNLYFNNYDYLLSSEELKYLDTLKNSRELAEKIRDICNKFDNEIEGTIPSPNLLVITQPIVNKPINK